MCLCMLHLNTHTLPTDIYILPCIPPSLVTFHLMLHFWCPHIANSPVLDFDLDSGPLPSAELLAFLRLIDTAVR